MDTQKKSRQKKQTFIHKDFVYILCIYNPSQSLKVYLKESKYTCMTVLQKLCGKKWIKKINSLW